MYLKEEEKAISERSPELQEEKIFFLFVIKNKQI